MERTHDRVMTTELEHTARLATPGAAEAVVEDLADLDAGRVAHNVVLRRRFPARWANHTKFVSPRAPSAIGGACLASIFGPLAEQPHRIGRHLRGQLAGLHSSRRGSYQIVYRIDNDAQGCMPNGDKVAVAFGTFPAHQPPLGRRPRTTTCIDVSLHRPARNVSALSPNCSPILTLARGMVAFQQLHRLHPRCRHAHSSVV